MENEITEGDFETLAAKLEGLELTNSEKVLLNAIIENADDEADVTGFSFKPEGGLGFDNATWLLNTNITKDRVQVASRWTLRPDLG